MRRAIRTSPPPSAFGGELHQIRDPSFTVPPLTEISGKSTNRVKSTKVVGDVKDREILKFSSEEIKLRFDQYDPSPSSVAPPKALPHSIQKTQPDQYDRKFCACVCHPVILNFKERENDTTSSTGGGVLYTMELFIQPNDIHQKPIPKIDNDWS